MPQAGERSGEEGPAGSPWSTALGTFQGEAETHVEPLPGVSSG